MYIYVVRPGDTIFSIAGRYGTSPQRILSDNGLSSASNLVVGQALLILIPTQIYTVQEGDTLYSIAQRYNTTAMSLMQNNPDLIVNRQVYPGQVITISFSGGKINTIETNGYAYDYIDKQVLLRTLPYLSRLTIFSYGFTESGELIGIEDEPLIELAREYGALPIMLISSIGADGRFNGERASFLFNNVNVQNTLLDNIIIVMREKGYAGLDIDFEYINPNDREAFTQFVRTATNRLNAQGFSVNVDLAPKTSPDQEGLLYEGHDYAALGAAANTVLLMTYEWGYTYGPPMAVAPINSVRRVVEYGISEIDPRKIFMGIPNYGYDWPLPFVQGVTAADSVGNGEALMIAHNAGAQIEFDEVAQSPFFSYWNYDTEHVVWFEDARSIQAKMQLLNEKNLFGAGYWNIMRPFQSNWSLVNYMFNIVKY